MHLQSSQILWMMFVKILLAIIQQEKKLIVFDNVGDFMTNKKFQAVIKKMYLLDARYPMHSRSLYNFLFRRKSD